jgi:hypothetical protein
MCLGTRDENRISGLMWPVRYFWVAMKSTSLCDATMEDYALISRGTVSVRRSGVRLALFSVFNRFILPMGEVALGSKVRL